MGKTFKKCQDIILFGINKKFCFVDLTSGEKKEEVFEGVIKNLERQFNRTDSIFYQRKISAYISEKHATHVTDID